MAERQQQPVTGSGRAPSLRRAWRRWIVRVAAVLSVAWALLSIPECGLGAVEPAGGSPFTWDQDAVWEKLEQLSVDARVTGCPDDLDIRMQRIDSAVESLRASPPDDPGWDMVERGFFAAAAQTAGCPERVGDLLELRRKVRVAAKDASLSWQGRSGRERLYRLLYGTRAAVEELLLQLPRTAVPVASPGRDEPSTSPSVEVHGVRIHSGDILISRGGAPTSAFIARGNDYPGNFSHVALVHVDEEAHVSVIEAHIERGVTVTDVDGYLADKKLRIMVLRMRSKHPAMVADPLLPHRAATAALDEARSRHVPYDFEMDFADDERKFCSEVASAAFRDRGVTLWKDLSTFSTPGLARWMASLGVRHFETQSPSDLELDPQLVVVAEWHDPETLLADHVDNAVIDAMIEQAESGTALGHAWAMLPLARLLKAYSVALNLLGREGPIPEGMSATIALRVRWLNARHAEIRVRVMEGIDDFRAERRYTPPYWELVRIARASR
jgi:hypothetical protein